MKAAPATGALFGRLAWPVLVLCSALLLFYALLLRHRAGADFLTIMDGARAFAADPLSLYGPDVLETMLGFLYPPPSIIVFLPFLPLSPEAAYRCFLVVIYLSAATAVWLWLRLMRSASPAPQRATRLDWAIFFLCALATRQVFENAWDGQVNTIVLALCVLYVSLVAAGRPGWAGAVLAAGCWIKLYPAVLVIHALRYADRRRFMLGLVSAGLAIPLASLVVVPSELYWRYATQTLPTLSRHLMIHISNQSAAAFITRLGAPMAEATQTYHAYPIHTLTRLGVLAAVALGLAAMLAASKRTLRDSLLVAASSIALIAPMAPLGWGHTYVYMLPLLCLTAHAALERRSWPALIAVGLAIMLTTIPSQHVFPALAAIPAWAQDVIYTRDLFATLGLLALAWRLRTTQPADSASSQAAATLPLPHFVSL